MDAPKLSAAERLKSESRHLRGLIAKELPNDSDSFTKPTATVLKFHGMYQQDDRDLRKIRPGKLYSFMVRVSLPGGVLRPEQYLALDRLAEQVGDGTLRITSRGGVQYHYVGKRGLQTTLLAINEAGLSTFAACGDVVRNIVCCAAPFETPIRAAVGEIARTVNRELKPKTRAYAEIWVDGEKAVTLEADGTPETEPIYGSAYLPRKFKIGFAFEGENTTDIYSHDLGLVAHSAGGTLEGFTLLAGGGMGQTNGIAATHPRMADPVGYIAADDALDFARAAVSIHRDFGDRSDRRHARLKYVIEDRGVEWFRGGLQSRAGRPLHAPRVLIWNRHTDYLGWHTQSPGRIFLGLRIVNGRLALTQRDALREVVTRFGPEVRFTPQQNLILAGLAAFTRPEIESILREHGVPMPGDLPPILRHSMACPALPTCGLALAESERVSREVAAAIQAEFDAAGLSTQNVHLRMTGCPNGCARPYTAEIGIVGQSTDLYSLYLAGSPMADRLAALYTHNVPGREIAAFLRPIVSAYRTERLPEETFGDYCHRAGVETLKERHLGALV